MKVVFKRNFMVEGQCVTCDPKLTYSKAFLEVVLFDSVGIQRSCQSLRPLDEIVEVKVE